MPSPVSAGEGDPEMVDQNCGMGLPSFRPAKLCQTSRPRGVMMARTLPVTRIFPLPVNDPPRVPEETLPAYTHSASLVCIFAPYLDLAPEPPRKT